MKNRFSSVLGTLLLVLSFLDVFGAQDSLVITLPNKQVAVSFPQEPYKSSENFFLPTGSKEVTNWQYVARDGMEYQFSYFLGDYVKNSDIQKAISQWISQTGLKNQAQMTSNKKIKSGETTINRVEYTALNNNRIIAYFFSSRQSLCRVSVVIPSFVNPQGREKTFLESITFTQVTPLSSLVLPNKTTQADWLIAVAPTFEARFPQNPAAIHYNLVSPNNKLNIYNYVVENYAGISYIISHFTAPSLNKTEADYLLKERISLFRRSKNIYELSLDHFKYPCTEYFFKDKHYYYKYRVFKKDNSYYQLLIKSDKKSVSDWKNEYFFENFSLF